MIDRIKAFFREGEDPASDGHDPEALQLAAVALMVEAAVMDQNFDAAERTMIGALIRERFALNGEDAEQLIALAEAEIAGAADLYGFTRIINDRFSAEERIELIEMLWRVAYADGQVDAYESNLLRRVAGLIYVSDRDSGLARQRARAGSA